ncbi:MAG: tetratricopeptide repeat protein [Rikenellaceae bacterium]|nr:tetratricopeptide repeat protein [Rikenellaceae bacterium]
MKINNYILIIAVLFAFGSCLTTRSVVNNYTATEEYILPGVPEGYDDSMAASFYFQNGLKMMLIYGDSVKAMENYRKALEYDPEHSATYYEMANIQQFNNIEEALGYSRSANSYEYGNLWYRMQLGQLFILGEKYDSALVIYNNIRELAPNNPDNYRYLAALHEQTGDINRAIATLDTAEMRFGPVENIITYRRLLLINAGQINRAIEESERMVLSFPYDERNYVILGELYMQTGRDSLAYDAFQKALEIDMHSIDALGALTDYYLRRRDIENFLLTTKKIFDSDRIPSDIKINFYNGIIANSPLFVEYYIRISEFISTLLIRHPGEYEVMDLYAHHLLKTGNLEEPAAIYKQTLADSVRLEALNMIIDLEQYLNRPDSVAKYMNIALANFPDDLNLYFRNSYFEMSQKKYKEAEKTLEKAQKYAGNDSLKSAIYSSMADIRYSEDSLNYKRIYPLYDKALKLNPDNILTLNNYSYYLSVEGRDLERALSMIERVMEIEPGNPVYIDTYGWILYKLGRYEEAKKVLRQAVSLDPYGNGELYFHYAEILFELKEYFMASLYWRKALENGYNKEIIEERLNTVDNMK